MELPGPNVCLHSHVVASGALGRHESEKKGHSGTLVMDPQRRQLHLQKQGALSSIMGLVFQGSLSSPSKTADGCGIG